MLDTLTAITGEDLDLKVHVPYLLGPVLVGVLLNCFVYGVVVLHWMQYVLGWNDDGLFLKLLVHWCILVDSTHSVASIWLLWNASIPNFADKESLVRTSWVVSSIPLFVGKTAAPIQHLFAWRIRQFTHSWILFGFISLLSVASTALAITTAIEGLKPRSLQLSRPLLISTTDSWLALAMACDVMLAVLLYMHLLKSKTGFRHTDTVIGRLMRSSVETTALSALFSILFLLNLSIVPKTNFYIIFSLPLGRIYTGTLLSTLNSRSTLREELFGEPNAFEVYEIPNRLRPDLTINVDIEQEVQTEQSEDVNFKRLRKEARKLADGDVDTKSSSIDLGLQPV